MGNPNRAQIGRGKGLVDNRNPGSQPMQARGLALGDEIDLSRFNRGSGWVVIRLINGGALVERGGVRLSLPPATPVGRIRQNTRSLSEGQTLSVQELDTPGFDTPVLDSETFQEASAPTQWQETTFGRGG